MIGAIAGDIAGAAAEAAHGVPPAIADQARACLTDDLRGVLERFEERVARGHGR